MSASSSKIIITILFFLFIFASGFWLSRRGKPYSSLIITIHKLIGLGTGVYLGLLVFSIFQAGQLSTIGVITVSMTVMFFLGLVASGGLLSAEKKFSGLISSLHTILPYLTVISTILLIFIIS